MIALQLLNVWCCQQGQQNAEHINKAELSKPGEGVVRALRPFLPASPGVGQVQKKQ